MTQPGKADLDLFHPDKSDMWDNDELAIGKTKVDGSYYMSRCSEEGKLLLPSFPEGKYRD